MDKAPGIFKLALKSAKFYRKQAVNQVLIVGLLSAVITGSLLTGWSVRASLKQLSSSRLGNTGMLITSGSRFMGAALAMRLNDSLKIRATGLFESEGFCQNLASQKGASRTHILAVDDDFFRFHGLDSIHITEGTAAINIDLARRLELKKGDELIIRFRNISEIPSDAPFAPERNEDVSAVLRVAEILNRSELGNFSLSISQLIPGNIFISLSDAGRLMGKPARINRILVGSEINLTPGELHDKLRNALQPSDLGLSIIDVGKAGLKELRSERIFLDEPFIKEIRSLIPGAAPVITYLGNKFSKEGHYTPYSFISALPAELYPEAPHGDKIIINKWMADDLRAKNGDTIKISWYSPDSLNKLIERSGNFVVSRIVELKDKWADSLLMPDFPGISGSESCSDWDAGVLIRLNEIRKTDEDYWKHYRGTPKAFIEYNKGASIWGSNFGPATALRFPGNLTVSGINSGLRGSLSPEISGIYIRDLRSEAVKAASESVDFSSLFLSLGFFLIAAAMILLALAFTSYIDSRKDQIKVFFALGFTRKWIRLLILAEALFIVLAGSFIGSLSGIAVNNLIISLLNTVWKGAVQTSSLSSFTATGPIVTGFIITTVLAWLIIAVRLQQHMKLPERKEKLISGQPGRTLNGAMLIGSLLMSVGLFISSFILKGYAIWLSFGSGMVLFITMILGFRQYLIRPVTLSVSKKVRAERLSGLYYSFNPSHAVVPDIFIAAGIFAVFITGANRVSDNGDELKTSGGTGGYLLWCETSVPLLADLSQDAAREDLGFNEEDLKDLNVIQLKRSAGDDASCLNLNHVTVPPVLGVDPQSFIKKGAFSFDRSLRSEGQASLWGLLDLTPGKNTIYGIADQTVLDWGLKISVGDTIKMRSENGQPLNIIMAAGLKPSVFQGYVLIGLANFKKYFPSVSGSSVMLADGSQNKADQYIPALTERLQAYGPEVQKSADRLASFTEVTNTYLSVFGVFGALGMIIGAAGLGFILMRNFSYRKREYALMLTAGFSFGRIRRMIFAEQMLILVSGTVTGVFPALIATFPSLAGSQNIPWFQLAIMVAAVLATGTTALLFSLRSLKSSSLTASLRKD